MPKADYNIELFQEKYNRVIVANEELAEVPASCIYIPMCDLE